MSLATKLVLALALFLAGLATGWRAQVGVQAARELAAIQARESDAIQQRKLGDAQAGQHAAALQNLNNQLGSARENIARLSGRECLNAGTVRVLNAIGAEPVPAAAGDAEGAPGAATTRGDDGFASDADAARAIAQCRAGYAQVSDQLNRILDIEEGRSR